jgi:hypothetical protein
MMIIKQMNIILLNSNCATAMTDFYRHFLIKTTIQRVVHKYLQKTRLFVIFDLVNIFSVSFFSVVFDVNFLNSKKNQSLQ